jgi:hypothetical protein
LAKSSGLGVATLLFACSGLAAGPGDSAYLKTAVNPGRAGVFVDGKYVGPAANFRIARKYTLPPGRHEVRLVDPRYEEFTTTVDLAAGKTSTVSQTMKPLPPPKGPFGMLRTKSPDKFAAVYINDKFYGHAGEFNNSTQAMLLPPGEYSIRIEPLAGGGTPARKIQIEAGKTIVVEK